jgi:signal transduction histidine kinase
MSHELRTPMNAIIGYTEMVLAGIYGTLTPTQQDRLGRVYNNAKHLLDLINDILDLSRIETGNMKLDIIPTDVVPLVVGAIGNVAPMAEAKKLRISIELPNHEIIVPADPVRLRQVTLNLLGNAVKFTREGGIVVRVTKFTKLPDQRPPIMPERVELPAGDWVAIAIMDTGIGIARENFEMIFEAFQQVDSSSIREYPGTGLGLSICRQLVTLHQGYVWVESERGVGSTFTVVLPATLPSDNR